MKLSLKSILPPRNLGWNHVRARCGSTRCHNKLLMRALPQSRSGIHIAEQWFCSPDCFAAGVYEMLLPLTRSTVIEMPRNPRLTLGLAMLSKGFLTAEQLHYAAQRREACGESIEAILIRSGLATEKQIAGARAVQWGHPVVPRDLTGSTVNADLPRAMFEQCSAVPLHYSPRTKRLVIGFVERVDHQFLQSVEQATGFRPEPCFITRTEFQWIASHMTASAEYREAFASDCETLDQMCRTLGGWALEVKAREAVIVRCKSFIWARLSGGNQVADVVFPAGERAQLSSYAAWDTFEDLAFEA